MGRTAHDAVTPRVETSGQMDERGELHVIEDDLSETWVEEWAESGVEAIEQYLAKHAAFRAFLEESASS